MTRSLFRVRAPDKGVVRHSVVVDVTDQPPILRRDVAEDRGARFLGIPRDLVSIEAMPIPRRRSPVPRVTWS